MTPKELEQFIESREDEHCEFKEAKQTFNRAELNDYCVAIANELGGKLVLGVTNKKPRRIVGSAAFPNLEDTKHKLLDAVRLRIEVEEVKHPDGRVLVFHIPSRPIGTPLHIDGRYLMRSGESLVAMTPEQLQRIFAEGGPDFSCSICPDAIINDLDTGAVEVFRARWHKKTGNAAVLNMSVTHLLEDSELSVDGKLTYAALILLASSRALGRYLPNAEVIWEYRAAEGQIPVSQRLEFRQGFLTFHDELWNQINARNEVTSVREGLFRRDIPAFNEDAVREAVLNAVCHRDYRLGGSVFVRQFPKRMEVNSPGGLPEGITPDNILNRQAPRNRRLAEASEKCGLVERSGQGMDRIFDSSLREGKGLPDFTGTDSHVVILTLRGEAIDAKFLQLLDLAEKHQKELNVHHLVILEMIRQGSELPQGASHLVSLLEIGLIERVGKGKSSRLILSKGMYRYLGQPGAYTRYKGLDRETNKQLLLKHVQGCGKQGAKLSEFREVLPSLTKPQIRHLVYELKKEGEIRVVGQRSQARWQIASDRGKD